MNNKNDGISLIPWLAIILFLFAVLIFGGNL